MKTLRYLIPLGVFLILVVFLYVGLGLNPRQLDSTLINQKAPDFLLPRVNKVTETMTSEAFQGKVSLLNVWASWCVSCRQEHPLLMQLAKQKTVSLYGLNWKDQLPDAQTWLRRNGDPYLASAFDSNGRTGIDYGVTGTPETFVIDKQGVVRYKHVGPISVQQFNEILWPMIQELQEQPAT